MAALKREGAYNQPYLKRGITGKEKETQFGSTPYLF